MRTEKINEDGDIAYIFRGDGLNDNKSAYRGINLFEEGQTKTIVDNNDQPIRNEYDNVVDKFYRFGFVDINNQNTIAFSALFDPLGAQNDPVLGIFTAHAINPSSNFEIEKVIAVGDTVTIGAEAKSVTNLLFYSGSVPDEMLLCGCKSL